MLGEVRSTSPNVLPLMKCPKLKHLEIDKCEINQMERDSILNLAIGDNVTVLKIGWFDDVMDNVLSRFEDSVCHRLEEFAVVEHIYSPLVNTGAMVQKLLNVVMRFRNLNALHLICPDIEYANTDFLFERCYKLEQLSLGYDESDGEYKMRQMLANVKENCKDLEVIQLVPERRSTQSDICEYITQLFPSNSIR